MTRISCFFLGVCMLLSACSHAAAPAIIENKAQEHKRVASLASNVGACVWVYCFWRSPSDLDPETKTTWDINMGVALDEYHVLTTHCPDETYANNWEDGYLESITIGSPDANNQSGVGPWQAKLAAEDNNGTDLVVLSTEVSLTLPSVVLSAKSTEIMGMLYSITGTPGDANLRNVDLLRVNATKYEVDPFEQQTNPQPDFAVLVPEDESYPSLLGVFNQNDEFVGFALDGSSSYVPVPLRAPDKFKSTSTYVSAYDVLSVHGKILKSLFRKAGVSW